jgi:hypothetical protein
MSASMASIVTARQKTMTDRASIAIPTELLEQIERGNVLLFIGERLTRDSMGEVLLDRLTAELAERASVTDTHVGARHSSILCRGESQNWAMSHSQFTA